jgi:hypothetical protein
VGVLKGLGREPTDSRYACAASLPDAAEKEIRISAYTGDRPGRLFSIRAVLEILCF